MTRPADVPVDLARIASVLVDDMHLNPDIRFSGILAGPTVERVIAEALAAERERAAKACDYEIERARQFGPHHIPIISSIRAAIRAGATHANT